MRVIVLTTGRSGSTTFARACRHIGNFTSGHELNKAKLAADRVIIPDNHIESDNRLTWLLGRLEKCYGDDACYVWLKRSEGEVCDSYARRWGAKDLIMEGYFHAILQYPEYSEVKRSLIAADYVSTVHANIELFLRDKNRKMVFHLHTAHADFERFWYWIGARGDLSKALSEWDVVHNASLNGSRYSIVQRGVRKVGRIFRKLPVFLKTA
uniref:Sulfotransferase family protein n=1 Tax=Chlorobium phaeobacteroides (strain BS1) TaxID=331678 RepID=B3ELL2_CHLPB